MTDRQTNKQTDIRTFRLIESIGPEGRCFENRGCRSSRKKSGEIMTGEEKGGELLPVALLSFARSLHRGEWTERCSSAASGEL